MTASALVDKAIEDTERDPRERTDVVLKILIEFYCWLRTDYPRRSGGRGVHIVGKGVSDKRANSMVNGIIARARSDTLILIPSGRV